MLRENWLKRRKTLLMLYFFPLPQVTRKSFNKFVSSATSVASVFIIKTATQVEGNFNNSSLLEYNKVNRK